MYEGWLATGVPTAAVASAVVAKTLYLIDGNSLAYRAFFALPDTISTSKGQPSNAIFGFASMLVKLFTEYGNNPTIVCWDRGTSGRKELDPRYKANRPSKPDLLREQWPHFAPIVESFGWHNVHVDGFEADDVIASLAEIARTAPDPVPVVIVTGDRDSFQLIDPEGHVTVMATARGITETKFYDYEGVIERYGIAPELIPDFYGLKGDSSDNIPGVPGIGDKTAAALLQQFGSLETILSSVDQISGAKRKENLTNFAADARLSKELATIQRDVPLELDPLAIAAAESEPSRAKLREVFIEFELRDPLRRIEAELGPGDDGDELEKAPLIEAEPAVSVTVEASSLAKAVALGDKNAALAIAVASPEMEDGELFAREQEWRFAAYCDGQAAVCELDDPAALAAALGERPVIVHDAKALGVVPAVVAHDTLLAAYLLEPSRRSFVLDELCEEAGIAISLDDAGAREAALTSLLAARQRLMLEERGELSLLDTIELPLIPVLRSMEVAGVRLNTKTLAEIARRVRDEITTLEQQIWDLAGEEFVIASPQQLSAILFEKLGLTKKRKGKTGYSTDARVLQSIRDEHEIIPVVERWRELNQLSKTYLEALPSLVDEQSRIHTTFVQAATATGRLASINPNMQNIPVRTELGREIRGCFEAAPKLALLSADYSQVELRLLAHVAEEQVLMDIFSAGEDVHSATAREVFGVSEDEIDSGMRSKAKMINYGIVYGLGDYGLADRLNISRGEAREFIDAYLNRFGKIRHFMDQTVEKATDEGFVTTLFGRRRNIPELRSTNGQTRALGERLALNTIVQGTAADVMKLAMIEVADAMAATDLKTEMILTIHDELLFEGPKSEQNELSELVERGMIAPWGERQPPLAVDIGTGRTWLEAK
ncbi:MAG: DNA polymerase I [Solirubrobacteraceae bacterium]|nr:DNA polymerase I [Solirubrobacteraceae bacterium]